MLYLCFRDIVKEFNTLFWKIHLSPLEVRNYPNCLVGKVVSIDRWASIVTLGALLPLEMST